jgi:molecular chaperone GrpE (heat shock protein)
MLQSTNKFSATAAVLSEFLPIMDKLMALREKYGEDEFGKMYNALPGAIKTGFTSMDCTEYEVAANEPVVTTRMVVVASEPSDTVPKDSVIRTVVPGMELQGNMMRLAQVVASSGSGGAEAASETSA